jgi:diguanylate cyclase (GGDEF)-like protein
MPIINNITSNNLTPLISNSGVRLLVLFLYVTILFWSNITFSKTITDLDNEIKNIADNLIPMDLLKSYESDLQTWGNEDLGRYYMIKAKYYEDGNEIDLAKENYTIAIKHFEKLNFKSEQLVNALIERSYMTYIKTNNINEYCSDRRRALELARQLTAHKKTLARALIHYSFCFDGQENQFSEALKLLEEAIKIAQEHDLENNSTAMIYNATAILYRRNNILNKSYEYFMKAYQEWQQSNDIQDMFNMQHAMVFQSLQLGNYEIADQHVQSLFKLSKENPNFKDFLFFSYFNAGLSAFEQNKYKEADINYKKMLSLKNTTNEKFFISEGIANLAVINFKLKNIELARQYAQKFSTINSEKDIFSINNRYMKIINHYADKKYFDAINGLWELMIIIKKDKQKFVVKSAKAQALMFDKTINQFENKILEQELAIKNLNLISANSQTKIALLSSLIIAIMSIVFLLTSVYLWHSRKKFKTISQTDYLTRIFNRRYVFQVGQKLINASQIKGTSLTLFIFDIDDFKNINDNFGHNVGDDFLKKTANICQQNLPPECIFGRIGGEEFLYMIENISPIAAKELAEKIRIEISHNIIHLENRELSITISTGICTSSKIGHLDEIIKKADIALYEAKNTGKNKVVMTEE